MTADQIWTWVFRGGELILFSGVLWALAKLISWLSAKAATSKVFAAVQWVTVLVDGVLSDVAVGVKPDIDAALSDGTVTPAERQAIATKALTIVKNSLGTRGLSNVGGLLSIAGDALTSWISGVVNNRLSIQLGTVPLTPASLIAVANATAAAQAAKTASVPH